MKKLFIVLVLIMSLLNAAGCQNNNNSTIGRAEIIVSRNFGKEIISENNFEVPDGAVLLDIMEDNFQVETAYGGSFINSIDGLQSGFTAKKNGEKLDWFFYVNGILSQIGSGDYEMKPDDCIIWDYHDWDTSLHISSIVGAFPDNFTKGYNGPLGLNIMYTDGYENQGETLRDYLTGIGLSDIELTKVNDATIREGKDNVIVIGAWDAASKYEYLKEIYGHRFQTGLFFEIDQDIKALDFKGDISATYEKGAVIASTLNGYDVMSTIWLITGNSKEYIEKSVKLLCEDPDRIKGRFSVLITGNQVIDLPLDQ